MELVMIYAFKFAIKPGESKSLCFELCVKKMMLGRVGRVNHNFKF